jgi:hypothetical protein
VARWPGFSDSVAGSLRLFGSIMRGRVMMIRWAAFALFVALVATATQAQTQAPPAPTLRPSPRVAPTPQGYCLAASAAFLESETKAFDEMKKCARGDTIVIPAKSASAVARMCDFTKAIVTTPDHVVCVIVMPERVSK